MFVVYVVSQYATIGVLERKGVPYNQELIQSVVINSNVRRSTAGN